MTKHDRAIADLLKAVREHNELVDPEDRLSVKYDGITLDLLDVDGMIIQQVVYSKVKYTRGVNYVLDIVNFVKKNIN